MALHEGKTKQEWLDQIAGATVDSVIRKLIEYMYDNPTYTLTQPESYNTLVMNNKPSREICVFELSNWKVDEAVKIEALFAELEEQELRLVRIEQLKHGRSSAVQVTGESNGVKVLNNLVINWDEDLVVLIEAKDAEIEAAFQAKLARKDRNAQNKIDIADIDFDANMNANEIKVVVKKLAELAGLI